MSCLSDSSECFCDSYIIASRHNKLKGPVISNYDPGVIIIGFQTYSWSWYSSKSVHMCYQIEPLKDEM